MVEREKYYHFQDMQVFSLDIPYFPLARDKIQ